MPPASKSGVTNLKSAMSREGVLIKVLNDTILSLAWFIKISGICRKVKRRSVISDGSKPFSLLEADALRGTEWLDKFAISGVERGIVKENVRKVHECIITATT